MPAGLGHAFGEHPVLEDDVTALGDPEGAVPRMTEAY